MKKNLLVFVILLAFAAALFSACANGSNGSNDSNNSNNSSSSGSSTTVVSGKIYTGVDSIGTNLTLSFANNGNSVSITEDSINGTGTYSMSGNSISILANGYNSHMTYNPSDDSISYNGFILRRL